MDSLNAQIEQRRRLLDQGAYGQLHATLSALVAGGALAATPAEFDQADAARRASLIAHTESLAAGFEALANAAPSEIDPGLVSALLAAARRGLPRAGLMLSGGGTLGNYHFGVLHALARHGLLPSVISGASAGSFAGAVACTRDDAQLMKTIASGELAGSAQGVAGAGRALDTDRLRAKIAATVPDLTFAEAEALSGRALNVVVTRARDASARILDPRNAPDVLIRGAVLASCAVPGRFSPVTLEERSRRGGVRPFMPGETWVDGSLSADMPAEHLHSAYGVGVTIASLANPIVLPWIPDPHTERGLVDNMVRASAHATKAYMQVVANVARIANPAPNLDFLLRCWAGVSAQTYTGDINIMPPKRWHDPRTLLVEADSEGFREYVTEGERSTLSRLKMVQACTALDRRLDRLMCERRQAGLAA